jgi:hypothetical protein
MDTGTFWAFFEQFSFNLFHCQIEPREQGCIYLIAFMVIYYIFPISLYKRNLATLLAKPEIEN